MLALLVAVVATLHVTDQSTGSGLSAFMGGGGTTHYERHDDSYSDGTKVIPGTVVEALRRALVASEKVQAFEPRAFGITPEWVRDARPRLLRAAGLPADAKGPAVDAAVSFENISAMAKRRFEGGMTCMDCVSVRVEVRLDGPEGFEVSSVQDIATMIPWRVTLGGRTWNTWSLDVSRAVAAMVSGASRKQLENVGFWPDGIFDDPLLFIRLGATAADELGVARAREMTGAAAMLKRFDVVRASLRFDRFLITLRPKHRATFDQLIWSDAHDATSWEPLLKRVDDIERFLARTKWVRAALRSRQASLSFEKFTPQTLGRWSETGLRGKPDAQLQLSGAGSRASLIIAPDDERVLIQFMQNMPEIDANGAGMTAGVDSSLRRRADCSATSSDRRRPARCGACRDAGAGAGPRRVGSARSVARWVFSRRVTRSQSLGLGCVTCRGSIAIQGTRKAKGRRSPGSPREQRPLWLCEA